jgi:hypothetical protein
LGLLADKRTTVKLCNLALDISSSSI